jgi:hydroxyacylglutathione hydrolase
MLYLKSFCFNPFQENTYVLFNEHRNAFIIDPGNSTAAENRQLKDFILQESLSVRRLLLTHAHIDHILGNRFVSEEFGLLPEVHMADQYFIEKMKESAALYGLTCDPSPLPTRFLKDGDLVDLDGEEFLCMHTPGHSPGSITFYNRKQKLLISGDVLFNGSIGRSDLPMGDHETLIRSINEKLMVLDEDTKVYPGHGPFTTIGREKTTNPFLT